MVVEYMKIMELLGWPPIFLIPPYQFAMIEGADLFEENMIGGDVAGMAAIDYPVITVHPALSGRVLANVLWHEVAHHLWPWKPHWWIELFAQKMARGGGTGIYTAKYKKKLSDLPPRGVLLKMARRQAAKLKERYKIPR